jgi:plasmid maintenance system antidote protein VapI
MALQCYSDLSGGLSGYEEKLSRVLLELTTMTHNNKQHRFNGELLAKLIDERGFRKGYVAERIGVNPIQITRYLKGQMPSVNVLLEMSEFFNIDMKDWVKTQ